MTPDYSDRIGIILTQLRGLAAKLKVNGYNFLHEEQVRPPNPHADKLLERIETVVGKVPGAIRAFYEQSNGIDFLGSHPTWGGCEYPDPIYIFPLEAAIEELAEWQEMKTESIFKFPISMDKFHKANVSGGMWHNIQIPNESENPIVMDSPLELGFIEYIQNAIKWAGFAGLQDCKNCNWPIELLKQYS